MPLRSFLRSLFLRRLRTTGRRIRSRQRLSKRVAAEALESRAMLSASFEFDTSGAFLNVDLDNNDAEIFLRTLPENGSHVLQFSQDGTAWSSDFNSDGNLNDLTLDQDFTITVGTGLNASADVLDPDDGAVHLVGLQTADKALTVTSVVDLYIEGDITTETGHITLEVSDTINIAGGTLAHTQSRILIGEPDTGFLPDADSNSDGRVTITGGNVTIEATQTEKKSQRQVFGQDSITATIDITDSDLSGDQVSVIASSQDLVYGDDSPTYSNYIQPYVGALVDGVLGGGSPAGLFFREAESAVTITDSTLTATDDLQVNSLNHTDATATAIAARPAYLDQEQQTHAGYKFLNTLSVGVTSATGTATIDISGASSLTSILGDVAVKSDATVKSSATARTTQNINKDSPAHEFGGSFSVTLSDTTVTATLGEQASIAAPSGSVNFEALGTVTNTGSATSSSYKDGTAGLTVAVGSDTTTVTTTVDGDIQSGGTVTKTQSFATADIGPDDFARINTLTIPGHGFVDGQTVDFRVNNSSGDTPSIGDLVDGESLRVRVLNENSIQLYLTEEIDLRVPNGDPASQHTLSTYDTLPAFDPQQVVSSSSITIPGNPFEAGQAVLYRIAPPDDAHPSEPIDGLFDGTTYYVIPDAGDPDRFQLALSAADALNEQAVQLTGPGEGDRHYLTYVSDSHGFQPATGLNPGTNTISIAATSGIETGDPLLYQTDPGVQNTQVIERQDGFTNEGLTSSFDATGTVNYGQPVLEPATYVLTVPNHGWQTGDSVVYSVSDKNGESSLPILVGEDSELTDGATYRMIRVDNHTIQLALPESSNTALELVDGSESGIQQLSGAGQSHFFDPAGTVQWQAVDTIQNTVLFDTTHGLVTGQRVTYSPGQNASGQPNLPIGGLVAGEDYYVIKISDYEIQLSHDRIGNPQRDIFDGLVSVDDGAVNLGSGATGTTDSLHQFFGHTVDTLNDWIISPNHELETGQAVTYNAGDGTAIDGLTDGTTYYAIRLDGNTIRLADSVDAVEDPVQVIDQSAELFDVSITNLTLLQMFRPNSTELSGLSVYPRQDSWSQLDVTLELYDSLPTSTASLLARDTVTGVSPGEWATVFFDQAIPVNPGSPYYLKFSVPVLGSLHDPYPDGQLFTIDGAPGNSSFDLAFRTFTTDSASPGHRSLDSTGTGTLQTLTTDSFVFPVEAGRSQGVVDAAANTIELIGHGLTSGQRVNYQTSGGDAVGGLEEGQLYGVLVPDDDHIQLTKLPDVEYTNTETPVGLALSLNAGATLGTGLHVFRVVPEVELFNRADTTIAFDPTMVPPVDLAGHRIRVPGHGLSRGDSVRYLTGGGVPVGGLANGTEYFAMPVTDSSGNATAWLQFASSLANAESQIPVSLSPGAAGDRHGIQISSLATQSDVPVGGLNSGATYYAIVDSPGVLRLAESPQEALGAVAQDLTPSGTASDPDYSLESFDGIQVSADLTAKNTQNAGTLIGSSPTLSDFITKPEVIGRRFYNNKLLPDYRSSGPPKLSNYSEKSGSFVAGVAVNLLDHSVSVTVGSTDTEPVLTSATDVEVAADITQKVQTKAQGNAVTAPGRKYVFSAGFAWSNVEDTSLASVGNQASIDAPGTLDVTSNITYPLLVSKHDLIPFTFSDCHDDDNANTACHPLKDLSTYLDGSFGLSRVLNTWANSKAFTPKREQTYDTEPFIRFPDEDHTETKKSLPKAAFTFSIGTGQYTNESRAIIRSGARINQSSIDAGNSQVNVLADTDITLVGLAGIMQLRLNEDAAAKAVINFNKDFNSLGNAFSLTANKSESFGLGFSYMEQILTDITVATIESGALISSGRSSRPDDEEDGQGVTVKASEFAKTFNFSQSGADSEGVGVAGSVGITRHQDSFTVASVDDGVVIDSDGRLTIAADSEALHSVGAGSFAFGDSAGIGLSAGVIVTDRQSGAFLGALPDGWNVPGLDQSSGGPASSPSIDVSDLVLDAANRGQQTAVSVVGSVAKGSNRASGAFVKGVASQPLESDSHIGIAGDTAINVAHEDTLAQMSFTGQVTVLDLVEIQASNRTDFLAVSGAAAIAWNREAGQKASVAMTAAVARNEIHLTTESILSGQSPGQNVAWTSGSLEMNADSTGVIFAVTAALGIANVDDPAFALNVAFSLGWNELDETVLTHIDDGDFSVAGSAGLSSENSREIHADGGGAAFTLGESKGVAVGIGTSTGFNDVQLTVDAAIRGGTLHARSLSIDATANPLVQAWALAGAGEFSRPTAGREKESILDLQVAGALAFNSLSKLVATARIERETAGSVTIVTQDDLSLTAVSTGSIEAVVGQALLDLSLSSGTSAVAVELGTALSFNEIGSESLCSASIVGANVTAGGAVRLDSDYAPDIRSVSVAASLGVMVNSNFKGEQLFSVDGVGSAAVNRISGTASSVIAGGTVRTTQAAAGDVHLAVNDKSQIQSITPTVMLSVSTKPSLVDVSAGIAYAENTIGNTVTASIEDNASVDSAGDVIVSASSGTAGSDRTDASGPDSSGDVFSQPDILSQTHSAAAAITTSTTINLNYIGTFTHNQLEKTVQAHILSSAIDAAGDITVSAEEQASIRAVSSGSQLTVQAATGKSGIEVRAGAITQFATNDLHTTVTAEVIGCRYQDGISAAGSVMVSASKAEFVSAEMYTVSVGAAIGSKLSIDADAAITTVRNTLGSTDTQNSDSRTHATIDSSSIDARSVTVEAASSPFLYAKVWDVDIQVSLGADFALAAVYGQITARSLLADDVSAGIRNNSDVTATAGDIQVLAALDLPPESSQPDPNLDRYSPPDSTSVYAETHGVGVAVAASESHGEVPPIAVAVSVIRSHVESTSRSHIIAEVENSSLTASGNVTVSTADHTTIYGVARDTSVAISDSLSVGVAVPLAEQTVENTVQSTVASTSGAVSDIDVIALSGDIDVSVTSDAHVKTESTVWSAAGGIISVSVSSSTTDSSISEQNILQASVNGQAGGHSLNLQAAQGSLNVQSQFDGHAESSIHSGSISVGIGGAVDTVSSTATNSPGVSAFIQGVTTVDTFGTVLVQADAEGHAQNESKQTSVGLVFAGSGLNQNSIASPTVSAWIGDPQSTYEDQAQWRPSFETTVEGDEGITLRAQSFIDAATESQMIGGSIDITVLSPESHATVTPTVKVDVGPGTHLKSLNAIEIEAFGGLDQSPRPSTFDASRIDDDENTIEYADLHRLQTGNVVQYSKGVDNDLVPGLQSDKEYQVIVVTDKLVQLGSQIESSQSSVDVDTDQLRFNSRVNFQQPFTPVSTPAGIADTWEDVINQQYLDAHWDDIVGQWDAVIYRPVNGSDFTIPGLLPEHQYRVNRVSDDSVMLVDASQIPDVPWVISGADVVSNSIVTDGFHVPGHGFVDDQHVTYRAADPVVFSSGVTNVDVSDDSENPGQLIFTEQSQADLTHSLYLGNDINRFRDGDLVEYRAAAAPGTWYWTEGPVAEPQSDDTTDSSDSPHSLTGTQFWAGGSADEGGSVVGGAYANWATGSPAFPSGDQHYVTIDSTGVWNEADDKASDKNQYVIEYPQFVLFPDEGGKSQHDARKFAKQQGGWLPSITSEEEWQQAKTAAAGNTVWLGGSDDAREDTWVWDGGGQDPEHGEQFWDGGKHGSSTLSFAPPWQSGEPNDGGSFTAVRNRETGLEMLSSGYWNDEDKDTHHTAILVEFPRYQVITTLRNELSTFSFADARDDAKDRSGWIATIGSQDDNDLITGLMTTSTGPAWIGASNDQVIQGLENGGRYQVRIMTPVDSGSQQQSIQLLPVDANLDDDAIAIDNSGLASSVNHSLTALSELPLTLISDSGTDDLPVSLESGRTYYVNPIDSDHFYLTETPHGNDLKVNGTDWLDSSITIGNAGFIGTMGVDLTDVGQGLHNLVFDIAETSGTQNLVYRKGLQAKPDGTGTASSYVHAAGGTLIAQSIRPRSTSTANPDVAIVLSSGSRVQAARDVDITALSAGNANASTEAYGGAIVSGAGSHATSIVDHKAKVQLYGNLHANRHLTVESKISDAVEAHADTKSYGSVDANALSNTRIAQSFTSVIDVDQGARLSAGDSIELNAYTYLDDMMTSNTHSGALFGTSKANQESGSGIHIGDPDNASTTEINISRAHLLADEIYLNSRVLGIDTAPENANGEVVVAFGGGMQNANQATARVDVTETTLININNNAKLVGDRVEITATQQNLNLHTRSHTRRGRAASKSEAGIDYTGTSQITSSAGATVVTENLTVQADQFIDDGDIKAVADSERGHFDPTYDLKSDREIEWNATVLGRRRATLDVDADGTIVEAEGLVVQPYRYVDGNYTFEEAQTHAESLGGQLVTIRSAAEQQLLEEFIATQPGTDDFWIGASDEGHEGTWKWLEDEQQDVTFWTQTGDELFWTGGTSGHAVDNAYSNWGTGYPVIDQAAELDEGEVIYSVIAQSFQPGGENMSGASVKVSPNFGGQSDVTIELHDDLPASGETLLTTATALDVSPGEWATVQFEERVTVDPGATYYLVFSLSNGTAAFSASSQNPYSTGRLFHTNGLLASSEVDLAFRTFTEVDIAGPAGDGNDYAALRMSTDDRGNLNSDWITAHADEQRYYVLKTIDDNGSQTLELRKNSARESGTWTWQEALADAASHSPAGTIADVQSAADEEQLRELFHEEFCEGQNNPRGKCLPDHEYVGLWINASDEVTEGEWTRPVTAFEKWNSGEPNNANHNENAAQYQVSNHTWNDLDGAQKLPLVVEFDQITIESVSFEDPQSSDSIAGQSYEFEISAIAASDEFTTDTATVKGTPLFYAHAHVDLENHSSRDLVVGDVDLVSFPYSPNISVSSNASQENWAYTTTPPAGETLGGQFYARNLWSDPSTATPLLQISGTINNPSGVVELKNLSGDITGGGGTSRGVIEGHEIFIDAPDGAVDSGASAETFLIRLYDARLLSPNLSVTAGGQLTLDVQAEPDDTGRARGVDRLEGSVVDVGLLAWDDYSILQDDPVGYWDLNETAGTVARDASRTGVNGTYANVTWGVDGPIKQQPDTAVSFSGTGSVTIPDSSSLYGNQAQTVTGWFKVDRLSSDFQPVYFKGNEGTGTTDYTTSGTNRENTFWVTPTGQLHFSVTFTDSSAQEALTTAEDPVEADTWYHFATVADLVQGKMSVYLNGELLLTHDTGTDHSIHDTNGDWLLGQSPSGSELDGALDDFAIFNTVLSEDQIARQYDAGIADGPYPVDTHYVIDGFVADLQLDALHREIRSTGNLTITGRDADGTPLADATDSSPTVQIQAHVEIADLTTGQLTVTTNGDIHLSEGVDYIREKIDGTFSYAQAFTDAGTNGRWLTTISDSDEQRIVRTVAEGEAVWFGANDVRLEGDWNWVEGQVLTTPFYLGDYRVGNLLMEGSEIREALADVYTNWAVDPQGFQTQPVNSYSNEHFAVMRSDGFWDDVAPVWDAPSVQSDQVSWLDAVRQYDPVGFWRLGEAAGEITAVDLNNKINGTYSGVTLGVAGAISYDGNTAAGFGDAASNSHVSIPDDTRLYGHRAQTVTGWFQVDDLDATWQAVYFKGDSGDDATDYGQSQSGTNRENTFWVNSSGLVHMAMSLQGSSGQLTLSSQSGLIQPGQWHHFATVIDAEHGELKIYLDGQPVAQGVIPSGDAIHDTSGDWRLGNSPSGMSSLHGLLDDYAIYNTVLTADQIEKQYSAGISSGDSEVLFWQGNSTGAAVDGAYTNWNTGEPNNNNGGNSENHVELKVYTDSAGTVSSYWNDVTDDQQQYYVLKTLDVDGNPSFELRLNEADTEGQKFTWQEALVDAENRGGVVANITKRQDEELFIQLVKEAELLAQEVQVSVWVNATDELIEGQWRRPVQVRGNPYVLETPQGLDFVDGTFTFANAWFDAYQRGGWVATVNSAEEQESIAALADGREIWLGASDSRSESFWHWLEPAYRDVPFWKGDGTGTPVDDAFTNWNNLPNDNYPPEPNNDGGNEDFGELGTNGGWNDLPVTSTRPYIATTRVIRGAGQTSTLGQTMRVASITSSAGNVWLDAPGDVEIDGVIQTGAENTFTWNGTGQVLNDTADPGSPSDLQIISASLQLAGIGGLGSKTVPLHTQVQSLHAFVPIHSIYVRNEGNLDAGDLVVHKGDLQIVTEGALEIDGPLSVEGGGYVNLVANGSKTVLGMIEGEFTHAEAAADAITRGGRLPVILTEEDQQAVEYVADGDMVWIGATDEAREGDWQWSIDAGTKESFYAAPVQFWNGNENGSPVNNEYQNWNIGEPNNFNDNENHIEMYVDGKWNDINQDVSRRYVLETDSGLRLSSSPMTYSQAVSDAIVQGGHIASVRSAADQQAVFAAAVGNSVWINATDEGHEGEWWRPVSGYPVNGHYENWAEGQPDNYQGLEHFGGLRVDGTWNDFTAENTLPYVLEYDTSLIIGAPVFTHGGDGNINLVGSDGVRIETEIQYIPGSDVHFRGQDNQVNYAEAKTDAALRNGWLAVLTSDQAIQTALTAIDGRTALAGGTDEGHEGDWRWVDSPMLPEDGVTFWLNGEEQNGLPAYWNNSSPSPEPNGGVNENILEIESDGSWNDLAAGDPRNGYLLQRPSVYTGGYGQIVITAGTAYDNQLRHGSNTADIWMQDGASVTSEHGNIVMLAAQDIWLSNVATSWKTDAASRIGDVLLVADYGGIESTSTDAGGVIYDNLTGARRNIVGQHLLLAAEGSQNDAAQGIGSRQSPLQTQVRSISATTDGGDIAINNHGELVIGSLELQIEGFLSEIGTWQSVVPDGTLPARTSKLLDHQPTDNVPGLFQMSGLVVLNFTENSSETASISVNSTQGLTVSPDVPVINLEAGDIRLSALGKASDSLEQNAQTLTVSDDIRIHAAAGTGAIHLLQGPADEPRSLPLPIETILDNFQLETTGSFEEGSPTQLQISPADSAQVEDPALRYFFSLDRQVRDSAVTADGVTDNAQAFTFPQNGNPMIYVRVLYPGGPYSDFADRLTIRNTAPANLELLAGPQLATPDQTTTLSGQFFEAGTFDTHQAVIAWGDGHVDRLSIRSDETETSTFTLQHNYSQSGTFQIDVRIIDNDGEFTEQSTRLELVGLVGLRQSDDAAGQVETRPGADSFPAILSVSAQRNLSASELTDWDALAMAVLESERMDATRFSFRNAPQMELARLLQQISLDHAALIKQINQALRENQLDDLDGVIDQPPTSTESIHRITRLVLELLGPPLVTDSDQVNELRDSLQKLQKQLEQSESRNETPRENSEKPQKSDRNPPRDRPRDTASIRSDSRSESSREKFQFLPFEDGKTRSVQKSVNADTAQQRKKEQSAAQVRGDRDVRKRQDTAADCDSQASES